MAYRVVYTRPYDAEVEYLESTGTQWIDTDTIVNSLDSISVTLQFTKSNAPACIWNARNVSPINNTISLFRSENNLLRFDYGKTPVIKNTSGVNFSIKHEYKSVANTLYVDGISKATNTASSFTAGKSVKVLASSHPNNASIITNFVYAKLYSIKIINSNNEILRDLIPVRVGLVGYMYDKVSGKLFGNKGTGNFILGPDVANPVPNIRRVFRFGNKRFVISMPYDSRVEYIKSDSNQYLDIGIIPKSGYRAICEYMPEKTSTTVRTLFGQRESSTSSNMFSVFMAFGTNCQFNAQYADSKSAIYINNIPNVLHTIELGEKSYLDGNLLKTVTTTFNGSYTISIFATHQNFHGSVNYNDRRMKDCRVYSFKLYNDSDTLIFDGIPVRRGTKGYMYDKVSGRLFGNSGTGQFILGNDIND